MSFSYDPKLAGSTEEIKAPRPFDRYTNASLATIAQGFKALVRIDPPALTRRVDTSDRVYFLFPNGQLRRDLGRGHSQQEREARKTKTLEDYALRRTYKRERKMNL